jgi:hypothetical protein
MPRASQPTPPRQLHFVTVTQDDPRAQPLLDALAVEYAQRYEATPQAVRTWLTAVPIAEFAPPDGGFVIGSSGSGPTRRTGAADWPQRYWSSWRRPSPPVATGGST